MTTGKRWWRQLTPAAEAFERLTAGVMAGLCLLVAVVLAVPLLFSGTNMASSEGGWVPVGAFLLASVYAKLGRGGMTRLLGRVIWPSKRQ